MEQQAENSQELLTTICACCRQHVARLCRIAELLELAGDPFAQRILQGIRGGNPALPMELRPALGETNRFQNLQTTVAGTRAQVDLVGLATIAAVYARDFYGPGLANMLNDPGLLTLMSVQSKG